MNEADLLGVRFGEVVELGLGCGSTTRTDVSVCSGAEEVTSRRDHFRKHIGQSRAVRLSRHDSATTQPRSSLPGCLA